MSNDGLPGFYELTPARLRKLANEHDVAPERITAAQRVAVYNALVREYNARNPNARAKEIPVNPGQLRNGSQINANYLNEIRFEGKFRCEFDGCVTVDLSQMFKPSGDGYSYSYRSGSVASAIGTSNSESRSHQARPPNTPHSDEDYDADYHSVLSSTV